MSIEKSVLSPAAMELIGNVSGAYSAPFWDGLLEVSGALDTVRKIRSIIETLYQVDKEIEAYNLILAVYDLIALETPSAISELATYPDAIKHFITEFLLDIDDLMNDYEYEEENENL